ncbi:MAG: hypothetical protein GY930_07295, partial [bacterium]|nr:hypothetical protein [bacterium]
NIIPIKTPEGEIVYMQILNAPLLRWYQHRAAPERVDALSNAMNLHKKLFTFSTTTARVLFQWFRNPVKDIGTAVLNTRTSGSAGEYMIHALGAIFSEFRVAFNTALGKDPMLNEYQDLFMRLGLEWSTELAADSVYGRSLVRKLAGGKKGKFEYFWDTTLGFLQAPEKGVRTAELELYSKEMMEAKNLDSLDELSMDQMLELTLAAKQVSTNFTVAGRTSKKMNRWIPFFNAQIQGPRDTFRAIMAEGDADRRSDKILRAISFYTIPALVAWWWVKDEDWYIELTPREKASSWFIPVGGDEFLVLPLPFEIGTIFSAMPITFVDAAYRENPGETDWVVSRLIAATTQSGSFAWDSMPNMAPPLARTYMDVSSNNKSYWDTPIVSASMMRLEKKAQYDEFTTHLARWIGKSAGELGINDGSGWSPKVIEHIAKGLTGPLGLDVMETLSGTDAKEMEGLHTLPIVGKQFKEALAYPKSVTKLYETYNKVQMRFDTKVHEESEDEMNVRLALRDAIKAVSSIGLMLRRAEGDMRTALKEERLRIAKDGLRIYAEGKIESGLKTELRKRRKELETEKKRIKTSIIEERQASLGN